MTQQHTNRLLGSLSHENRELLLARCTAVSVPCGTVFYEPNQRPSYGWFLTSGLASIVAFTKGDLGTGVERMGDEGVVGSLHLLGPAIIPSRCFMQIAGTALRIDFADLQRVFWACTEIRARLLELVQEQVAILHQSAACHLHHEARERLASLLLVLQDRTQGETLDVTQELLATMLGTRRSTISVLAAELQREGLIAYSRGQVCILNRNKLEVAACSCYPINQRLYQSLYGQGVPA
ncbi:MAG: Crp/Fnr family transcriptional regulator [Janthinobacterium lividum]